MQNQRVITWSVRGDSKLEAGLLVLAMLFFALAARAEQPSPARPGANGSEQRIEIFLVGALGGDQTLGQRVTSWFHRTNFRVTASSAPNLDVDRVLHPQGELVLRAWVVLLDETHARLYFTFVEPRERRTVYLVRDLRLERGLDEIGAEHIAEVLHLSVLALVEGQAESRREELEDTLARDASMLSEQSQSSDANPSSPADRAQPNSSKASETARRDKVPAATRGSRSASGGAQARGLEYGLGYGGSFRGDEGLWHGPRASLHLRGSVVDAAAVIEGAFPSTHTFGSITLRTYGASAAFLAEYHHALSSSVAAEGFAGPGLDLVHYAPERSADSEVSVAGDATEGRPKIVLGATLVFGHAPPRVSVVASASIALTRTHYDVVLEGENHVVGRPWMVFPTAGAELRF
jgi:hypothetical protein